MSNGLAAFTIFHVVLSLIGIFSGFVVIFGLIAGKRLSGWTPWFLWTTLATNVTGFMFPFHKLLPSYVVGAISTIILGVAFYALYSRHLVGGWRRSYVITSVIALYLNVFVLIAQLFAKVPALKDLAPTQTEMPFKVAQIINLVVFLILGIFAAKGVAHEQAGTHPSANLSVR
ncbi:MAG: hypothetical protein M3N22_08225 [Acidobacteriota bacterium]|nr:hypothetical protein [Acidobacteriota bacterium]